MWGNWVVLLGMRATLINTSHDSCLHYLFYDMILGDFSREVFRGYS